MNESLLEKDLNKKLKAKIKYIVNSIEIKDHAHLASV